MNTGLKDVKRFPALVIGVGGTGVRTLRFVRWQAESGIDSGLRQMYEDGHLQLLAIDTDWKANREEELDEHVVPRSSAFREGGGSTFNRILPPVESLIGIRTEAIVKTIEDIRRIPRQRLRVVSGEEFDADAGDEEVAIPAVIECLPSVNQEALSEMSLGQARYEGAGQWRPLGRIGLFTEARAVYDALKDGHERVRKATETGKPVRVHLVCSLSGGTGAGMFWDVAFMMRHIDPNCALTGCFLLADPFLASDRAERVEANAYAALKELAAYKNWRLRPDELFKVRYPIGRQGLPFEAKRGDTSVFNLVYLYQSFKPEGEPGEIPDLASSTIRVTCLRMAESILAQLRRDVRAKLDEGANNEKTDVNAPVAHRERGFVFSTSAVTPLALAEVGEMARTQEAAILNRAIDDTGKGRAVMKARGVALALLHTILMPASAEPGKRDGERAADLWHREEEALKQLDDRTFLGVWREIATQSGPPQFSSRIKQMRGGLDDLTVRIKELEARHDNPAGPAQTLYALLDDALRTPWAAAITAPAWSAETGGVEAVKAEFRYIDLCKAELDEKWQPFRDGLTKLSDDLEGTLGVLDENATDLLRNTIKALEELPKPNEFMTTAIKASPSLIQMRIALNIVNETRDETLIARHGIYTSGPLPIIMRTFSDKLYAALADAERAVLDAKSWPATVAHYLYEHRSSLAADIGKVLAVHERNRKLLDDRNNSLHVYGLQKLRDSFTQHNQLAERFERMMAPLPAALRAILNSGQPNHLDVLLDEITGLFARETAREPESVRRHCSDSPSRRTVWKEFLQDIVTATEEVRTSRTQKQRPLVHIVAELMDRHFIRPHGKPAGHLEAIRTPEGFELFQALTRVYATGFVRFWSEQEAFIIARLNGDQGLEELISRCRSVVFSTAAGQTIQQAKLVIGKPQISLALSESWGASDRNSLMNRLKTAARKVLNATPIFTEEASPVPVIYYEELYRAGAEIAGIHRYHRRYRDTDDRFRSLFHFQRGAEDLDDLVPDDLAPDAVLCGNRGCQYDLSRLPGRDHLICPGCGGPILNRCGNPACAADDLTGRLPQNTFDASGRPTVRHCPACHGELKTYWWHCSESAHSSRYISMREKVCPQCLEEYLAGTRSLDMVRRRSDNDPIDCPGCMAHHLPSEKRTRIPAALQTYFKNGVSPLDRQEFEMLIERHHFTEHHCPNHNASGHLLFPSLEIKDGNGKKLLHVHRAGHVFSAEGGQPRAEHHCFHCGFPIAGTDVEAARIGKPISCPRCQRALQACPYCSPQDGALFQPQSSIVGAVRCPRCTNLMIRDTSDFQAIAAEGLKRAGFCRNLFGCNAGARPWSTAAEYALGPCRACGTDDRAPLLPFEHLSRHIDLCPICLVLLGRRDGNKIKHFRPEDIAADFRDRSPHQLPDNCVICGSRPAKVLNWMMETGYFDAAVADVPDSVLQGLRNAFQVPQPIPDIPAELGMDILEAMLHHHTAHPLHEAIMSLPGLREGRIDLAAVQTQFSLLFAGPQISARAVRSRLADMVHISEEVRTRERATADGSAFSF